jgi:hypothetical protein
MVRLIGRSCCVDVKIALVVALTAFGFACRSEPQAPAAPRIVGWRTMGTWSGHGNAQLETFPIERWDWRINWETSNEKPPKAGTLHVTVHSADSGRMIVDAIDVKGPGRDTVDISEQPHRFYLAVESENLDWELTVEEPVLR